MSDELTYTEKRKIWRKRYNQSEKGREANQKYRQTDKYKRQRGEYAKSAIGREKKSIYNKAHRKLHPNNYRAKKAVGRAIKRGTIIRPETCEHCGKPGKIQGHHESYSREHWLDVNWLCVSCHMQLHHSHITL